MVRRTRKIKGVGNFKRVKQLNLTLDLHGTKHEDVKDKVQNFVLLNQKNIPLKIICGNSERMIQLVREAVIDIGFRLESFRYGELLVYES